MKWSTASLQPNIYGYMSLHAGPDDSETLLTLIGWIKLNAFRFIHACV